MEKENYKRFSTHSKLSFIFEYHGFPGGLDGKESACNAGDLGLIPGLGRFPWRKAGQPTPVWRIPWTEEPGGLQSTWLQSRTGLSDKAQHTHSS